MLHVKEAQIQFHGSFRAINNQSQTLIVRQQRRYSQDFINEAQRFLVDTDLYEETQIVALCSFIKACDVYFCHCIVLPTSKYIVSLVGFHTNGF